jgi:hypothetical protein
MREKLYDNFFCASAVVLALAAMLYSFRIGGWTDYTFSALGRANPVWFVVFVAAMLLAIISNLWVLGKKLNYNGKAMYILLFTIIASGVIVCVFNHEYIVWIRNIHNIFAKTLNISSGILLAMLLAYRHQRRFPYIAFLSLTAILSIMSMFAIGMLAVNQAPILISIMLVAFIVNYIDPPRAVSRV